MKLSVAIPALALLLAGSSDLTVSTTDLGTLSGSTSAAYSVNSQGQVVGYASLSNGQQRGFLWQSGAMTDLGTLGGPHSFAFDINDHGVIVGRADLAGGGYRAVQWVNGNIVNLGGLSGGGYSGPSQADGISGNGRYVTGRARTAAGPWHGVIWDIWSGAVIINLGTLGGDESYAFKVNDAGQVVGWAKTATGFTRAFLWENGVMRDLGTLSGAGQSEAYDINSKGQVVGWAQGTNGRRPFLWENGSMRDLGVPDGFSFCLAWSINVDGQVAGHCQDFAGQPAAFLWYDGTYARLTEGVSAAFGIGANGRVVGYDYNPRPTRAKLWSVAIEPAKTPVTLELNTGSDAPFVTTYKGGLNIFGTLSSGGMWLPDRKVDILIDDAVVATTTTVNGGINLFITLPGELNAGDYPTGIGAAFAGDETYAAASFTTSLKVEPAFTTIGVWEVTAALGEAATMTAYLWSPAGDIPPGQLVSFKLNGADIGGATTSPVGSASGASIVIETAGLGPGSHPVEAAFAGTHNFAPSTGTGTLVIVDDQPGSTPTGTNVAVEPVDPATGQVNPVVATFTFESVTGAGETAVTTGTTDQTPPANFKLSDPPLYYDISTTATYSGTITICLHYDPAVFTDPSLVHLLHGQSDGTWTPVTSHHDRTNHIICGQTTSLSPFAIAQLNRVPVANAGGPYTGLEGSSITFTGSGIDEDGDELTYSWDLDGDGLEDAKTASAAHLFTDNGSYTVRVTVRDGYASHTAEAAVTVDNVAPGVSIASGATLIQGETYTSDGSFTDPGADAWTGTVDYGDGGGSQALPLTGKSFDLNHQFTTAGSYTVRVTVADDDAGSGAASATVAVLSFAEATLAIVAMVDDLVRSGALARAEGTALNASYEAAANQFQRDNRTAAANQLNAGLNKLQALVGSRRLSSGNAQPLMDATNRILRLVR